MKTYLNRVIRNKYLVRVRKVDNTEEICYVQEHDDLGIVIITQKGGSEKAIRWEVVVDITTLKT